MKDLYEVKKVMAEAVSAVFKEAGLKHDDDYRNWILPCSIIRDLLGEVQDVAYSTAPKPGIGAPTIEPTYLSEGGRLR